MTSYNLRDRSDVTVYIGVLTILAKSPKKIRCLDKNRVSIKQFDYELEISIA